MNKVIRTASQAVHRRPRGRRVAAVTERDGSAETTTRSARSAVAERTESPRFAAHEARPLGCLAVNPGRVEWREGAVIGSRERRHHPLLSTRVRHVTRPVAQRHGGSRLRDKVGPCVGRTTVRDVRGRHGGENRRQQLYLRLVVEGLRRIPEMQLLSPIFRVTELPRGSQ